MNSPRFFYETSTEALQDLFRRGFTRDFLTELCKNLVLSGFIGCSLSPMEFEIVETYRFEGYSDPGDASVIYAVRSKLNTGDGIVFNAFGVYSNTDSSKLIVLLL